MLPMCKCCQYQYPIPNREEGEAMGTDGLPPARRRLSRVTYAPLQPLKSLKSLREIKNLPQLRSTPLDPRRLEGGFPESARRRKTSARHRSTSAAWKAAFPVSDGASLGELMQLSGELGEQSERP